MVTSSGEGYNNQSGETRLHSTKVIRTHSACNHKERLSGEALAFGEMRNREWGLTKRVCTGNDTIRHSSREKYVRKARKGDRKCCK